MKAKRIALLAVGLTAFSAWSQVPAPGFGDKGCSNKPLFDQNVPITGDDYIEVHRFQSYARSPVYTVRIYGDGRWCGMEKLLSASLGMRTRVQMPRKLNHLSRKPAI